MLYKVSEGDMLTVNHVSMCMQMCLGVERRVKPSMITSGWESVYPDNLKRKGDTSW